MLAMFLCYQMPCSTDRSVAIIVFLLLIFQGLDCTNQF